MIRKDTIVAIATPPGLGGIGIVRISGTEAERILMTVFHSSGQNVYPLKSHVLMHGFLMDGNVTEDECMAVLMRGPRSYTREDVAELHLHGGDYLLSKAVELCIRHGARLAEAGEFTRRAFINGRIDLSRAEAVMSMIAARGEQEQKAAIRELRGGVTSFVRNASDELYGIQAGLAACIDYPEEISEEEGAAEMIPRLQHLIRTMKEAVDERTSRLLRNGLRVALVGKPNVGKSSLLNALLGEERAIVTEIPGTTRDTVTGEMMLSGARILLTDTAGMRETEDPVEKIGVERSDRVMKEADVVLLVTDGSDKLDDDDRQLLTAMPETGAVIINKSDLPTAGTEEMIHSLRPDIRCIICSAREHDTLEQVKSFLRKYAEVSDRVTMTQPRHIDAVRKAVNHLECALETVMSLTPDMASTDLQAAQEALAEITGDRVSDKLLDSIFSQFCVGK